MAKRSSLSELHRAYLGTIESELGRLDAADADATKFYLSHNLKPASEAAAAELADKVKTAAQALKAAKASFSVATNNMQTALKEGLQQLHGCL